MTPGQPVPEEGVWRDKARRVILAPHRWPWGSRLPVKQRIVSDDGRGVTVRAGFVLRRGDVEAGLFDVYRLHAAIPELVEPCIDVDTLLDRGWTVD